MSANGKEIGGGKPATTDGAWWQSVPPIVPGQGVFSVAQFRLLLGGISESSYYEMRKKGLFKYSRADKGKQVVHTIEQYREYLAYLNSEGVVKSKSEIQEFREKKAASR